MGRLTTRRSVTRITVPNGDTRRIDALAVEEPLEIRVGGEKLTVTMRTPGHDVELTAGFLLAEGVIDGPEQFRSAIHCGGAGMVPGQSNSYNVLDVCLTPDAVQRARAATRTFRTSSACGACGSTGIDALDAAGSAALRFSIETDPVEIEAARLAEYPARLREGQAVFDKTGGLHAAALIDPANGQVLVLREDVGRHNAVDKVIGWALLGDRLPLRSTVLQVSGRASFELVQKAVSAGVPVLSAVSAPSSLAVELADRAGLTLAGFVRGDTMNVYTRPERITTATAAPALS